MFPIPDTKGMWIKGVHKFFYYFLKDSEKWKLLNIINPTEPKFDSGRLRTPPFLIFSDQAELNTFSTYLENAVKDWHHLDVQNIFPLAKTEDTYFEKHKNSPETLEKFKKLHEMYLEEN